MYRCSKIREIIRHQLLSEGGREGADSECGDQAVAHGDGHGVLGAEGAAGGNQEGRGGRLQGTRRLGRSHRRVVQVRWGGKF